LTSGMVIHLRAANGWNGILEDAAPFDVIHVGAAAAAAFPRCGAAWHCTRQCWPSCRTAAGLHRTWLERRRKRLNVSGAQDATALLVPNILLDFRPSRKSQNRPRHQWKILSLRTANQRCPELPPLPREYQDDHARFGACRCVWGCKRGWQRACLLNTQVSKKYLCER